MGLIRRKRKLACAYCGAYRGWYWEWFWWWFDGWDGEMHDYYGRPNCCTPKAYKPRIIVTGGMPAIKLGWNSVEYMRREQWRGRAPCWAKWGSTYAGISGPLRIGEPHA